MKLFGSPVATTVGYGHFHSVPATFLYMLRVEFADQIAADGIGLAEQSVFPVYRSAVTVYSCLLYTSWWEKENQVRICPFSKRAFAYQQHIPQENQTENETGKDTFSD